MFLTGTLHFQGFQYCLTGRCCGSWALSRWGWLVTRTVCCWVLPSAFDWPVWLLVLHTLPPPFCTNHVLCQAGEHRFPAFSGSASSLGRAAILAKALCTQCLQGGSAPQKVKQARVTVTKWCLDVWVTSGEVNSAVLQHAHCPWRKCCLSRWSERSVASSLSVFYKFKNFVSNMYSDVLHAKNDHVNFIHPLEYKEEVLNYKLSGGGWCCYRTSNMLWFSKLA